jgi:hypothetical protein
MSDVRKLEYQLSEALERPSFALMSAKAMQVWRKTEEGTELYDLVKELIDTIENEQSKMDQLKSLMYLIAGKM